MRLRLGRRVDFGQIDTLVASEQLDLGFTSGQSQFRFWIIGNKRSVADTAKCESVTIAVWADHRRRISLRCSCLPKSRPWAVPLSQRGVKRREPTRV